MENRFEQQTLEGQCSLKESLSNWVSESSPLSSTTTTMSTLADGCFDCNICLDFAMDPVVTLCGHLYCWPCIYKWLEPETSITQKQCPVCKATLSETNLVPLYGRGNISDNKETKGDGSSIDIPRRPILQHRRRRYRSLSPYDYSNGNTSSLHGVPQLLGISIMAMLPPWVFGGHVSTTRLSNRYYLIGSDGHGDDDNTTSRQEQRHEMLMRRSLDQVFVFLFCCTMLCWILF